MIIQIREICWHWTPIWLNHWNMMPCSAEYVEWHHPWALWLVWWKIQMLELLYDLPIQVCASSRGVRAQSFQRRPRILVVLQQLVGGLEDFSFFPIQLGIIWNNQIIVIIPFLTFIFFSCWNRLDLMTWGLNVKPNLTWPRPRPRSASGNPGIGSPGSRGIGAVILLLGH